MVIILVIGYNVEMLSPEYIANGMIKHATELNLAERWRMARDLGSKTIYGDNGFGDKEKLAESIKENKYNVDLKSEPDNHISHHVIKAHIDDTVDRDQTKNSYIFSVEATEKPYSDFLGKEYIFDISPENVFVIFPDLTFITSVDRFEDLSWKEWRAVLEKEGLFDGDYEGHLDSLVSLDKLRRKIKDDSMTDLDLRELRKKLYGFAYAIDSQIKTI
jgi:hypothetical protein